MGQIGIRDVAKVCIGMAQAGINCKAFLIHPTEVDAIWPHVEGHLEKATPHSEGEMLPEDMKPLLDKAEMQLWIAVEDGDVLAAMVTQHIPYPRKQVLRVISIGGGDMNKWFPFYPELENYAKSLGCSHLEAWGRKGWGKILKGWTNSYHIFTKEI